VLRNSHVHKKAQEHFQLRMMRRAIQFDWLVQRPRQDHFEFLEHLQYDRLTDITGRIQTSYKLFALF